MIRKTIAALIGLGLAACASPRPPASDPRLDAFVEILKAEDTRQWNSTAMERFLLSPDTQIRTRAVIAAGRIGDPAAIPSLADMIHKEPESVAEAAAFAIGEIESVEGSTPLLQALNNLKFESVRLRAIEGLGKIGSALPEKDVENRKKIGSAIVDALKSQHEPKLWNGPFIQRALIAAVRVKPEGAPAVIPPFLKYIDSWVRQDALNALARLQSKESLDQVRTMLADSDPLVRANAARVLGAAADKASVNSLTSLMSSDPDLRVRVAAIRAIAAIGDPLSAPALLKLNNVSKNELLEIAVALGRTIPNTDNANAMEFLNGLRDKGVTGPEVEIARARIAPRQYVSDPANKNPSGGWQQVSAIAQALGALAMTPHKANALATVETLAKSDKTPGQAMADILQALKDLKAPDLNTIALAKLKSGDFVTRAAAADILSEGTPSAEMTQALVAALSAASKDTQNDAALSIVGALAKSKEPAAIAALREASRSPDHLVRRKAQPSGDVGPVNTDNKQEDYVRAASRIGKKPLASLTTDKGLITIQLYADDAPLTVDSFIKLARAHYFDGLTFHRVVPNFVIQGGDPRGDGNGGPGYTLRCEINMQPYDEGAVGMALSGKDTGGSQFFVTHSRQPHLDGGYTVFGHIVLGQDVVNKIERGDRIRTVTIAE